MLSINKQEITDINTISIAHEMVVNHISERFELNRRETQILSIIHVLESKVYNRYVTIRDILSLVLCGYKTVYNCVKVLLDRGFVERINSTRYNVTLEGHKVIRSYETNISRYYNELKYKQAKEYTYIRRLKRDQKTSFQYPVKTLTKKKKD